MSTSSDPTSAARTPERRSVEQLAGLDPELLVAAWSAPAAHPDADASYAMRQLDWPAVCAALAQRTVSPQAGAIALSPPLLRDLDLIRRRLHEVDELGALVSAGDSPPLSPFGPLDNALARARRQAVLSAEALMAIEEVAATANAVRHYFRLRVVDVPLCAQVMGSMRALDELSAALAGVFEEGGRIADTASPELGALRRRAQALHDSMRHEIQERLKAKDLESFLQDTYYTLREGRYVLPIKTQHRASVPGIVHGSSNTGQTVFVEPSELVELNNRLRMAEFDVEAEELRVLQRLSALVTRDAAALEHNLERLVYLDLLRAAARLMLELGAHVPDLSGDHIALYQARHPLLALRAAADAQQDGGEVREVVPNDVIIEPQAPLLVVSGANAGGKTVTLKTVGVFALMVRAGLPLPAAPGSVMRVFGEVFADVGDDQSLAQDTSTFSSHILHLNRVLPRVSASSLVLLDEPFSGTDPAHASTLTIALLEHLHEVGASGVVTTHLDAVKAVALDRPWLANASVLFDLELLRPTYALKLGTPGGSAALAIARRLGFPEGIVRRAEELRSGDADAGLESALLRLDAERQALERARREAEQVKAEARLKVERLDEALEKARRGELDALGKAARAVRERLNSARDRLKEIGRALRESPPTEEPAIAALQGELAEVSDAMREAQRLSREAQAAPRQPLERKRLAPGVTAWSRTYQREVTVVEVDERGQVTLQAGILKLTVPADDLCEPGPTAPGVHGGEGRAARPRVARSTGPGVATPSEPTAGDEPYEPQTPENTTDLRGATVDEALERVEFFLDAALREERRVVYVIHGHGTGALKRGVRRHLVGSSYVRSWRPGEHGEGGDGVTVVFLRS